MNRTQIILDASAKALQLRRSAKVPLHNSVCVYDLAQFLDLEVRFIDIGSMEGIYRKHPDPLILISSLRPPGRQNFTCAHEIGHHIYGHGMHVDELTDETRSSSNLEEVQANSFASLLLMPKTTVARVFAIRGWEPASCTSEQAYVVAGWLGVGYTALIWHMASTLHLLPRARGEILSKTPLKQIRSRILGVTVNEHLVVVDSKWDARTIDLNAGDLVLLPGGTISEGSNVQFLGEDSRGSMYEAIAPGIGRFCRPSTDWAAYVRVSRDSYIGRSIYRYEPEDLDEDTQISSNISTGTTYPEDLRQAQVS